MGTSYKSQVRFDGVKNKDKLGLSWANLSSIWNWTLIFCRFGLSGFSLIDLDWYKFDLVDWVWFIRFGKLGSVAR